MAQREKQSADQFKKERPKEFLSDNKKLAAQLKVISEEHSDEGYTGKSDDTPLGSQVFLKDKPLRPVVMMANSKTPEKRLSRPRVIEQLNEAPRLTFAPEDYQ